MNTQKKLIHEFIFENKELFKTICSTHYPFTKDELRKYWDNIIKGHAFYTAYLPDMEKFFFPEFGLCWNSNVEWDTWLKNHWGFYESDYNFPKGALIIGFWDPFEGKYIEHNDGVVPLDISLERTSISTTMWRSYCHTDFFSGEYTNKTDQYLNEILEAEKIFDKEYGKLSFNEVSSFLTMKDKNNYYYKTILITHSEIWDNTLSKWIDAEIIKELFS